MPADSAAIALRRGIVVRLALASTLLIGLALAWYAFEPTDQSSVGEAPAMRSETMAASGYAQTETAIPAQTIRIESKEASTPTPGRAELPTAATVIAEPARSETVTQRHSEGMIRTLAGNAPERSVSQDASVVAEPVTASPPTAKRKLPTGPYLQVGVFTHPANAAELKARLEAEGIPVVIATRVQVGPFKNKKEAEEMRAKLKEKGMEALLINQ